MPIGKVSACEFPDDASMTVKKSACCQIDELRLW